MFLQVPLYYYTRDVDAIHVVGAHMIYWAWVINWTEKEN
jgi:hypothetical protein